MTWVDGLCNGRSSRRSRSNCWCGCAQSATWRSCRRSGPSTPIGRQWYACCILCTAGHAPDQEETSNHLICFGYHCTRNHIKTHTLYKDIYILQAMDVFLHIYAFELKISLKTAILKLQIRCKQFYFYMIDLQAITCSFCSWKGSTAYRLGQCGWKKEKKKQRKDRQGSLVHS